jgi:hypothetical protein
MVPSDIVSHGTTERDARRMSIAEWAALAEDESGELIDGYLVEEEMPDMTHEVVGSWLVWILRSWMVGRGGAGLVLDVDALWTEVERLGPPSAGGDD